jgi:hypothetical protein
MEEFLGALLVASFAYAVMKNPACDEACQTIFGAAGAQAAQTATAAAIGIAFVKATRKPRRRRT